MSKTKWSYKVLRPVKKKNGKPVEMNFNVGKKKDALQFCRQKTTQQNLLTNQTATFYCIDDY